MPESQLQYAVIGDPIAHSLSPVMHNAAFAELGIDAEYSAINVKEHDLEDFISSARKNLAGFNVTVPHKNAVIPFLDEISEECQITGSVNTVTNLNGHLKGESTDGYGLQTALREAFGIEIKGSSFLFLGCGGTVKAVSYRFLQEKAAGLYIANRTVSKAANLAEYLIGFSSGTEIMYSAIDDLERLADLISKTDVIIQATSLGLRDGDPSPLPEQLIRPGICMFDIVYRQTRFLKDAENNNIPHVDGSGMLIHQGAKSFSIWTGKQAPVDVMKQALNQIR